MGASRPLESQEKAIPVPVRTVFRGIGQVFFQENAITGTLFAVGIALELAAHGDRRDRRFGDRLRRWRGA